MTKTGITTGEAARGLGVNARTIANWMKHPKLRSFFSKTALGEDGTLVRTIMDEDFRVLNTIRELTAGLPNNAKNWESVAERLASGYRTDNFPPEAAMVRSSVVPLVQAVRHAESEARANSSEIQVQELQKELDKTRGRLDELTQKNLEMTQEYLQKNLEMSQEYLREIADLRQKLGEHEAELRLWREGRLKPSKNK
jgi:DNA repair exonuclease SbcCD ATPase subunit